MRFNRLRPRKGEVGSARTRQIATDAADDTRPAHMKGAERIARELALTNLSSRLTLQP